MPWIHPLPPAEASHQVKDLYDAVRKQYGAVLDPVAIKAHSEPVLWAYIAFERSLAKAQSLSKKLNYLATLYIAKRIDCPFCVNIGTLQALEAGVTQDMIANLNNYKTSDAFVEVERLVLEYCDALSANEIDVSAQLQERLRRHFSTAAIVELTAIIAWEHYRSRFNRALGIDAHGFTSSTAR